MHHGRRLAMDPQRAGGNERTFDAMRAPVTQHTSYRVDRLAVRFVIDRDRVKESLNPFGRSKPRKPREIARPQAKLPLAREPAAWQGFIGHGHISRRRMRWLDQASIACSTMRFCRRERNAEPVTCPGPLH
jgi:hypothetical protein